MNNFNFNSNPMNIALLESAYRIHAKNHGTATQQGDYKLANKSHDELLKIKKRLYAFGEDGVAVLLRLLYDEDDAISCWAATHLLPIKPDEAMCVLSALSQKRGIIAFDAKMVLCEWKAGRLKP